MFYLVFMSASRSHVEWLGSTLNKIIGVHGHVVATGKRCLMYQLRFGKSEALKILRKMYYNDGVISLSRKKVKVIRALTTANMTL